MDDLPVTEPFDYDAQYWALRDWGVPEELMPYAVWRSTTSDVVKLPPQLELPSGWDPDQEPRLAAIRPLLLAGAGLWLHLSAPFQLGWFAEVLPSITSLWVTGTDPSFLVDPERIEEMTALRSLSLMKTAQTLRLSQLPELEHVNIRSRTQFSAIEAPRLRELNLDAGVLPARFTVPTGLEGLFISAREVDLTRIGDLTGLRELVTDRAATVDLGPLAGSQKLRHLRVFGARSVMGVAALSTCTNLDGLVFYNVAEVDDLEAFKRVRANRVEAVGAAFDDAFAAEVRSRFGWWVQPRRGRGRAQRKDLFEVKAVEERVEVTFGDFGWVAEQLGDEDVELTSEDIEAIIAYELSAVDDRWLGEGGLARFDSEAEAVNITLPNSESAQELIGILNPLFLSRRRLRAVAKKLHLADDTPFAG